MRARSGSCEDAFTAIELSGRGGEAVQRRGQNRVRHLLMTGARYNPRAVRIMRGAPEATRSHLHCRPTAKTMGHILSADLILNWGSVSSNVCRITSAFLRFGIKNP